MKYLCEYELYTVTRLTSSVVLGGHSGCRVSFEGSGEASVDGIWVVGRCRHVDPFRNWKLRETWCDVRGRRDCERCDVRDSESEWERWWCRWCCSVIVLDSPLSRYPLWGPPHTRWWPPTPPMSLMAPIPAYFDSFSFWALDLAKFGILALSPQ